jgi:iron complex outermembrane receptor protein
VQEDLAAPGAEPITFRTLNGADETELGAYAAVRGSRGRTGWEVGSRLSWQEQSNTGDSRRDQTAWNGFVGVSRSVGRRTELRGSLSTGLRFPSLTERYFSGTTGRGEVTGNRLLDSERSVNAELSARWLGRRVVIGGVVFRNRIGDYIERVEVASDELTFVNVTSGTIRGLELQGVARLVDDWTLSWGGHLIDGEDAADRPLADSPPDELFLGTVHRLGRWRSELRLTLRNELDEPGSGEKTIPSAELLTAALSYHWPNGWELALFGKNLLDESYFGSADRKASLAPERSFGLQFTRRQP